MNRPIHFRHDDEITAVFVFESLSENFLYVAVGVDIGSIEGVNPIFKGSFDAFFRGLVFNLASMGEPVAENQTRNFQSRIS